LRELRREQASLEDVFAALTTRESAVAEADAKPAASEQAPEAASESGSVSASAIEEEKKS
jgi:hypothetical protein